MMDLDKAYKLISQKVSNWLHDLIRLLPNFVLAAVVLVIGIFIAGQIRKGCCKGGKTIFRTYNAQ